MANGYPYEDLSEAQFEALAVQVSKRLLGKAVQGFATGVDGGRDARFEGLADGFPSYARPWDGITIIQAKHTNSYDYFSDPDFSGEAKTSVLSKELPRAQRLHSSNRLDNYLLISNRYLTALANEAILERISTTIGVPREKIHLLGIEALDDALRDEPRLPELAGISPIDGPLIVQSRELAEVVEAIAHALNSNELQPGSRPEQRTTLAEKNELNHMTAPTSKRLMSSYSHLLRQIQEFLADPINMRLRAIYDECAEDFDLKILAHRQEYQTFDKVFSYLVDLLTKRDRALGRNRRLTRAVVFYMYWNCDIGETGEDVNALS